MSDRIIPNLQSDFAGGLNLRDAPIGLLPGELILSENIEPVDGGFIRGRAGQTEYNTNAIDSNPIRSLYRAYKQSGEKITILTSGTKVYRGNDASGGMTEIDSGYTADKKFSFTTWTTKDKIYWINGEEPLKTYDGSSVISTPGNPPIGHNVELHDDRLWILDNTGVSFSDLNVDNSWPAVNRLNLVDKYGGIGQFIKSFGRGLLIIAKDTGLYRFEGSPGLGGRLVRYSDVGCFARWSADVVTTQKGMADSIPFVAIDGVYSTDGFAASRISSKIDPLFTFPLRNAVGKYYAKKRQYWLSFNQLGDANNDLYVATALETADGTRISWNRYTNFKAESFAVWHGSGDAGEMVYGRSDTGKVMRADTGLQDVGANIISKFQTPWYDLGNKMLNKQVRWLYPVFEAVNALTYQVAYTFGKSTIGGQAQPNNAVGASWGPGTVTWGPGTVVWSAVPGVTTTKESVLFLASGRYFSFLFQAKDSSNFRFHGLGFEAKIKPARHFEPFYVESMT